VAFTCILLVACGGSGNKGTDIAVQDSELVGRGAVTFAASCALCHGSDLRGTEEGPSLLSEVYEPGHHADVAFLLAVQRGVPAHHWHFGDMPAVEGVDETEVAAIVAYVRETQRTKGFEPYPP
jgi:mono/diheme cytochrome c family protein